MFLHNISLLFNLFLNKEFADQKTSFDHNGQKYCKQANV